MSKERKTTTKVDRKRRKIAERQRASTTKAAERDKGRQRNSVGKKK